jgi:triphosphatase
VANEIELKLSIANLDTRRLRKLIATFDCTAKPVIHKLITVYYDTPSLSLLNAGISFRVRKVSGQWIQSVKAAGGSLAGLHQRMEWESPIANNHPDFTKIFDTSLLKLFSDQEIPSLLKPIFESDVQRTAWQLFFVNGDKVELVIDKGQLTGNKICEPISEIELELKNGHVGRLFDLALEIQKVATISMENRSKAERGYNFYRINLPEVLYASPPSLSKNNNVISAFKKIAWECIQHFQGNQDMVLHGADIEAVHQMRVALRRLRSAFSLFRVIIESNESIALLIDLKWLSNLLGHARDLDVFITETVPRLLMRFENHAGLMKLHDIALASQIEAYAEVRTALSSQRYQCLILTLAAWLENECRQKNANNCKRVKVLKFATDALTNRHKKLLNTGRRLTHMHPKERHVMRVNVKKLRYASEFFTCLYGLKKSQSFIRSVSKLQDDLGLLNDITNTEVLLKNLVGADSDPLLDQALYFFMGWSASNATHNEMKLDKSWRKFSKQKPFWL